MKAAIQLFARSSSEPLNPNSRTRLRLDGERGEAVLEPPVLHVCAAS